MTASPMHPLGCIRLAVGLSALPMRPFAPGYWQGMFLDQYAGRLYDSSAHALFAIYSHSLCKFLCISLGIFGFYYLKY